MPSLLGAHCHTCWFLYSPSKELLFVPVAWAMTGARIQGSLVLASDVHMMAWDTASYVSTQIFSTDLP